jgi:AcrR family transcriptional regulator
MIADRLVSTRLVDANGAKGATRLANHIAANPADVVGEIVLGNLLRPLGGSFELLRILPSFLATNYIGLHFAPPVIQIYRPMVGNIAARSVVVETLKARGRPSEGAREAVIEAARDLFVERDYNRVSVEEILERSGVSRGALYHHFATKLDLFLAVFRASEMRVIGEVASRTSDSAGPFEALVDGARAYLQLCETDEELRRIGLTQSRAVLGWEGWRAAASELGIAVVLALVSAATEAGQLPPHDPETIAQILLGALIEAAMLIVVAEDRAAARERSESVIVDLLEGLRA